jgi:cytochrome c-type biogenesis protein
MFENLFVFLYEAMSGSLLFAVAASFGWGVLSILLSPCHLSSIPLIVGYISSQGKLSIYRTFLISLVFSTGILITIGLIGLITAYLGRLMGDIGDIGNYLVAGIFFIVGLYLLDIINPSWNSGMLKQTKSKGLVSALMIGLLFGLALGPCTFAFMAPVLGIVFQTAQTNIFLSVLFLTAFGVGHCSIITGAGTLTGKVQQYLNWTESSRTVSIVKKTCGVLVILGGFYMLYLVM